MKCILDDTDSQSVLRRSKRIENKSQNDNQIQFQNEASKLSILKY